MDSIHFGAFIAQLRKELGMTQRELAEQLHVTDKAVSKWETGKGFPDVKLLEPLAQSLNISLVELIQGTRNTKESFTPAETEAVVSQAMDQSKRITAKRYLNLFKWLLILMGIIFAWYPVKAIIHVLSFWYLLGVFHFLDTSNTSDIGVIGGADGPTAIITASTPILPPWVGLLLLGISALVCFFLAFRVKNLEKKLK